MSRTMRDALVMAGFPPRRRRRRQILAPEVSSELDAPTREILEAGLIEVAIEDVVRIATNAIECFRDRSVPDLGVQQARARLVERLVVGGVYRADRPIWLPLPDDRRRRTLVNFGFVVVGEEFALPLRETVVDPGQADDAGPEAVARLTMVTCLYPTESRDARQPW